MGNQYKRHQVWNWLGGEIPPADLPFPYQGPHDQKALAVFRCQKDWRLLTDRMITKGICEGHSCTNVVILTLWERFLCKIGYIR